MRSEQLLERRPETAVGVGAQKQVPLSVCLVVHAFWPFDHGGVETYVHGLARALNADGHRTVVFHPFSDPSKADGTVEEDAVAGIDVVRINRPVLQPHQEFGDEAVENALRRVLWDRRVDVTHFHHLSRGLSASLLEMAWMAGTRVVLTLHDAWVGCPKGMAIDTTGRQCSGPESAAKCGTCLARGQAHLVEPSTTWVAARNAYFNRVLRLCDLVTSPSEYQARMIGRAPWLPKRIEVVPTGVDVPTDGGGAPTRKTPDAGGVRIGALSNFVVNVHGEDFKGAAVLAAASALLPPGSAKIHVYGAIDPPSRALLEGNPNLVLHGHFDPDRLNGILDELDFLVVPSLIENYPTVVREAFARRVPVICSDAGGLPELVADGVNGIVVAAGDSVALSEALTRAQQDPSLIGQLQAGIRPPLGMGEDAARWVDRYRQLTGSSVAPRSPTRVSVVIATYARPDELRRCLDGFVGQTLPRESFEIIVVDDCPQSPAEAVVESFRRSLDIRYTPHAVNLGLGEARRTGVQSATGDIVLFFDDDDIPGHRLLAEHVRLHERHRGEAEAVLGFTGVHPDVVLSPALYHSLVVGQEYFSYPALDESAPVPWHCAWGGRTSYKTSLLRRIGPRGRWLEDSDLNARLQPEGLVVHYTRNAVQYLTESLSEERLLSRARILGVSAARLLADRPSPALTGLFGGTDVGGRRRQLSPTVPQAETIVRSLAAMGLPALRRSSVLVDGQPGNAEELLHSAYSVLLAEANLSGRVIEETRQDGRVSFAALPDWFDSDCVKSILAVFLGAFHGDSGADTELYLCLPAGTADADGAFQLVRAVVAELGYDVETVPAVKVLQFAGTEADDLRAIWLRAGWGSPDTPGPSYRVVEGPDGLRTTAGLRPRSEALK